MNLDDVHVFVCKQCQLQTSLIAAIHVVCLGVWVQVCHAYICVMWSTNVCSNSLVCGLLWIPVSTWQTNADTKPNKQNQTTCMKQFQMMNMFYRERSFYQIREEWEGSNLNISRPVYRYAIPALGLAAWAFFQTIECDGNNIRCDVMKQRDVVTSKNWMSNKPLFAKETKQAWKVFQSFSNFTCQCIFLLTCFDGFLFGGEWFDDVTGLGARIYI